MADHDNNGTYCIGNKVGSGTTVPTTGSTAMPKRESGDSSHRNIA
jgi:hypothetical protein